MSTGHDSGANSGTKSWELSPYELHRQPQDVITENIEIPVSSRSLHSELMCPICLDMLKCTMTTKECLHRFCQECIITALRSGNKECPTCRKKLVSKRSLRHDPNFDLLISKLYPNRDEYNVQQERVINSVNKHFVQNIEESLRMQTLNRARNKRSAANDDDLQNIPPNGNGNENTVSDAAQEIELIIKPLPQVERKDPSLNQIRFMKTTMVATIDHIAKYLEIRFQHESSGQEGETGSTEHNPNQNDANNSTDQQNGNSLFPFTLYIAAGPGQYNPIPGSLTLKLAEEKYWKVNKPLELYYAYKVNTTS